jgi:hypothetical protein
MLTKTTVYNSRKGFLAIFWRLYEEEDAFSSILMNVLLFCIGAGCCCVCTPTAA